MPLDAETIKRLTSKKAAPAVKKPAQDGGGKKGSRRGYMGIRVKTHYPRLIKNDFVKHVPGTETTSTMGCTSYGCIAPSYYLFLGQPLCDIHLTYALVIELQSRANGTSGEPAAHHTGNPPLDSPLVFANDGSGEDDNGYL